MEKIVLEIHEDVVAVLRRIKSTKNGAVELIIPEGSVLFENVLNLKLLKKEAEGLNKPITFNTMDDAGLNLIESMENGGAEVSSDFVSREVSLDSVADSGNVVKKTRGKISVKIPSFVFLENIRFPKIALKKGVPLIVVGLVSLGLIGYGVYQAWWRVPKAEIDLVVNSQPLIKSVEIKVKPGAENNVEERILGGTIVESILTDTKTAPPTGEKIIGERAKGKVILINRTTSEKEFDDGEELFYSDDDDLVYTLNDDVTVPGATLQVPLDPRSPLIPGTAEADVTAVDIGDDYNLDSGKAMEFDDFNSSDFVAEVSEDIDGGESKIVSVVAQTDLDNLSSELLTQIRSQGDSTVTQVLIDGQVLINGSVVGALVTEEYNAELDEEVEEISLTQTVNFQGLAYREEDLDEILEDMLKGFVPSGFELSDEERETNVEILGNTDATILTLAQADLQVTIKAFVIPEIDEAKLKEDLVGVSLSEAERILGKIRNINNYEINLDPNIPFLRKLPGNIENITMKVKRE